MSSANVAIRRYNVGGRLTFFTVFANDKALPEKLP